MEVSSSSSYSSIAKVLPLVFSMMLPSHFPTSMMISTKTWQYLNPPCNFGSNRHFSYFHGSEGCQKWVESKNIPKWLVKLALSKKKMAKLLEECRSKFEQAVKEQITQCSEQPTQELLAKIEDSIDQEIEGLSAIDQL